MWKNFIAAVIILTTLSSAKAQLKKMYYTSGGELIFSNASIRTLDENTAGNLRFTGFLNFHSHINYDPNKFVGFFSGLEIQNAGFFYQQPASNSKTKFRTYNIGIPVGIKVGALRKAFLYAAYSIELPFHYKEVMYLDKETNKNVSEWFSARTPLMVHSLAASLQLPHGFGIKFKYYLSNFFNKKYTTVENGELMKPYKTFDANLFYISLTYNVLKKKRIDFHPFY